MNKRKRGQKDAIGKNMKSILRIVHMNSQLTESDIREKAKEMLNIREKTVIHNHLTNLEKKHLVRHDSNEGISNTWFSIIHQKINSEFEKCHFAPLSKQQLKMVDFLVEYSDEFMSVLVTKIDWCNIEKHILKIQAKIPKIASCWGATVDPEAVKKITNTWFLFFAEICLIKDQMFGRIDIDTPDFKKGLKFAYDSFIGDGDFPQSFFELRNELITEKN